MTNNIPKIIVEKWWTPSKVRAACVRNNLYTEGTNGEYTEMLRKVDLTEPTTKNLYLVACDINEHSEGQTVSNIMFILNSETVTTCYDIESEENR